ncbi:MAG: nucleotidyltransferase domain-containing protein [Rhodospirillales bacterium]|nr:nucleotidyltransferase domain-containing protein [Rhodospirillales bacterium]
MSRAAANTARYEDRMKAKGFVRKHVWVPAAKADEIEALAEKLRCVEAWDEQHVGKVREEIVERLRANADLLREALDIRHVTLFGSYARGDAMPESDVDIYVQREAYAKTGLGSVVKIRSVLAKVLGHEVDVVLDEVKNQNLSDAIQREGIKVF